MEPIKYLQKTIGTLRRDVADREKVLERYRDWADSIMDLLQANADGEISAGDVVQGIYELHHPDTP